MFATLIEKYLGWIIVGAFALVVAFAGLQTIRLAESEAAIDRQKSVFDKAYAEQALNLAKAEKKARDTEAAMNTKVATITKEKNDEIKADADRYGRIISGLQDRARRPAASTDGVPKNPTDGERGTGAGLYREDSEFLVGEAAESNRRRTALAACYKQYDEIERAYKEFAKRLQ